METVFVGKNLIFLPVTDSTNSYAIELLKNVNPPDGTVVRAVHQMQGKGQRGSSWIAEPASNLTVSFILKTSFIRSSEHFFLYIITALALHDTTSHLLGTGQFDIKIKWPNDILVNRQKISGILIENKFSGERMTASVIGVGLNVNQLNFGNIRAVSLKQLTGRDFDLAKVLELLCIKLEKYYLMLKSSKTNELMKIYTTLLFGLNETLDFRMGGTIVPLTVAGVGKTGLLKLLDASGKTIEADLKELQWLI